MKVYSYSLVSIALAVAAIVIFIFFPKKFQDYKISSIVAGDSNSLPAPTRSTTPKVNIDGVYDLKLTASLIGEDGGAIKGFIPSTSTLEGTVVVASNNNKVEFYLTTENKDFTKAIQIPFAIEKKEDGEFRKLYLSKGESDVSSEIKRSLSSSFQIISVESDTIVIETSDLGTAKTSYTIRPNTIEKKLEEIIKPPFSLSSKSHIDIYSTKDHVKALIGDGQLHEIQRHSNQVVIINPIGEKVSKSVTINLIKKEIELNRLGVEFSALVGYPLNYIRDISEGHLNRGLPQDNPPPPPLREIISDIEILGLDDLFWKERDGLIYWIDNKEEFASEVYNAIKNSNSDLLAAHLIGALGQTKTTVGQKMIIKILTDEEFDQEAKSQAIIHLGLLENPTEETISFAADMISGSNEISASTLFALGGLVGSGMRSSDGDGDLDSFISANNIIKDIYYSSNDLPIKLRAITALGNAGIPDNRELLLEALSDSNPLVRERAIDSMRLDPSADVVGYIFKTASLDSSAEVRKRALETLSHRNIGPSTYSQLSSYALNDPDANVRATALKVMYQNPVDSQTLKEVAFNISQNDSSSNNSELARAILKKMDPI